MSIVTAKSRKPYGKVSISNDSLVLLYWDSQLYDQHFQQYFHPKYFLLQYPKVNCKNIAYRKKCTTTTACVGTKMPLFSAVFPLLSPPLTLTHITTLATVLSADQKQSSRTLLSYLNSSSIWRKSATLCLHKLPSFVPHFKGLCSARRTEKSHLQYAGNKTKGLLVNFCPLPSAQREHTW